MMPQNVEIKARLRDLALQTSLAEQLCRGNGQRLHQVDVFFRCDTGRLKLRTFGDGTGELIFYRRANKLGPKLSEYVLAPTNDPIPLRVALANAYGEVAVVEKERVVHIHQRTRIHLDRVRNLGDFLELEVVLNEGDSIESGEKEAAVLMQELQIEDSMLISDAYIDLIQRSDQ
jgi:adenylate cyclase class IV